MDQANVHVSPFVCGVRVALIRCELMAYVDTHGRNCEWERGDTRVERGMWRIIKDTTPKRPFALCAVV